MQLKKLAKVFGIIFIALGVLGFVPGITNDGMLLGIFQVDGMHNFVHLLSGLLALALASSEESAQLYFMALGCVYALMSLVGFVQGDTVFGLIDVNMADNLLHAIVALALLSIGFGSPKSTEVNQRA